MMTEFSFGWSIPLICLEETPEHWLSKMLVFSIVVAGFRCDYTEISHYNTKLQGKLVNRGKYCVGDSKLEGVRDASRFAASLFTLIWHSLVLWSELTLHYLHIIRLYAGGEPRETKRLNTRSTLYSPVQKQFLFVFQQYLFLPCSVAEYLNLARQ